MHAFIDEYGTCSLTTQGSGLSSFYIPVAILVEDRQLSTVQFHAEAIRKKHFQEGEIKSQKVGQNHKRRSKVLKDISELDFNICAFAVNKLELEGAGFGLTSSFFKYISGKLYDRVCLPVPDVQLKADQFGGSQFMESFRKYVFERYAGTNVSQFRIDADGQIDASSVRIPTFEMVRSENEILVQVADFVAGSMARYIDPKMHAQHHADEFRSILAPKLHHLFVWPSSSEPANVELLETVEKSDPRIRDYSIRCAEGYIKRQSRSTKPNVVAQIQVLEILLNQLLYEDPFAYLHTEHLVSRVPLTSLRDNPDRYLRQSIVAPLRDEDVPICSSEAGFKLPATRADAIRYVLHREGMVRPQIERTLRFSNQIKLATGGDLDIISELCLDYLRQAGDEIRRRHFDDISRPDSN